MLFGCKMRGFMQHITEAFYHSTGWNEDNTYKELNATSRGAFSPCASGLSLILATDVHLPELIDFALPRGLRLTLSSLATPNFATSYQLGTIGVVEGSVSYLYSSVALKGVIADSENIPLPRLLRSYRQLRELGLRGQVLQRNLSATSSGTDASGQNIRESLWPEDLSPVTGLQGVGYGLRAAGAPAVRDGVGNVARRSGTETLAYGRLYLPRSLLEGLVIKRLGPSLQVQVSAVSEHSLRNGGTVLGLVQYDRGQFGVEGLASSDGGLLGMRGLYNFGGDASPLATSPSHNRAAEDAGLSALAEKEKDRIYGRFSAGGELYYGTLNKSGGVSFGTRFATLPAHKGAPLTATLTINPLMGNITATYAVAARQTCSLATRMEFNVFSYESEWAVGMELWSKRRPTGALGDATHGDTEATRDSEGHLGTPVCRGRSFQAKLEWRLDTPELETGSVGGTHVIRRRERDDYVGVVKARLDQNLRVGILWEGRFKSLIFSLGTGIDMRKLGEPFRSLGLDVQYSS